MSDREQVEVTMQALIDAAKGLNAVIDDMSDHGLQGVDDLGSDSAAYGHDRLAGAVRGFAEGWSYGLSVLVRDATGLSESLAESAETYAEAEHISVEEFMKRR
ncbi:hypothetical protein [Saccharopolyspora phatthalungensis]|uniref:Excreted virulence factor EspC (Type VII ESX diderm) n=1 Tax=Saccharopolyspora phatthalungensis TaxID=664693 RepID=A0A840QIV1_9PSEU|nr:hypothetical protein [Saccharopolyspora phatthalungensis]MBB5158709.1 hypothetical protein [Saccharopolyspora phatthalungensis]